MKTTFATIILCILFTGLALAETPDTAREQEFQRGLQRAEELAKIANLRAKGQPLSASQKELLRVETQAKEEQSKKTEIEKQVLEREKNEAASKQVASKEIDDNINNSESDKVKSYAPKFSWSFITVIVGVILFSFCGKNFKPVAGIVLLIGLMGGCVKNCATTENSDTKNMEIIMRNEMKSHPYFQGK